MNISAHGATTTMRLIMSVSVLALVTACAVIPEPFSQSEFNAKAQADRQAMFADQAPLNHPLTLEEAVDRVLRYNLDRRARMMEEALALGQLQLDRFDLLPRLTANAGYTGRSEPDSTVSRNAVTQANDPTPSYSRDRDVVTSDLGLTWNLLDFGVSYYTAHQNADRSLIASERRRKAVQLLAQEVRFSFWRAAAAQELRDKVGRVVTAAERALTDSQQVEAEKLRNPTDSLRMQKTLLESIRQLELIDQELAAAKAELAALINVPPGSTFTLAVDTAMPLPTVALSVDRMEEIALANNPDLREQDYQSRIMIDETRKEILKLLPGITVSASRQYDSNSFLASNHWNEVGARVSWNLLNVVSAPDRIDFSETREQVAEAKRIALRMAVLSQVHVINHQLSSASRQYQRATQLWQVEQRLAQALANQQRGGTQSEIDRIVSETSAIAAELRRYQTYAQVQAAFGKLNATLGNDPQPAALVTNTLGEQPEALARLDAAAAGDTSR